MTKKVDYIEKTQLFINSEKLKISLPLIVKLKSYIYLERRKIALTRKNIFKRDSYKCQYCGKNKSEITIDHVLPKDKGGKATIENGQVLCAPHKLQEKELWSNRNR